MLMFAFVAFGCFPEIYDGRGRPEGKVGKKEQESLLPIKVLPDLPGLGVFLSGTLIHGTLCKALPPVMGV